MTGNKKRNIAEAGVIAVDKAATGIAKWGVLPALFLSAVMQLAPASWVSDESEDYLKEHDYPETLTARFNTANIRIHGRYNPVSYLHAVGLPLTLVWEDDELSSSPGWKAVYSVKAVADMLVMGAEEFIRFIPPYTATDAWARPLENICYVLPPLEKTELGDFLSRMGDMPRLNDIDHFNLGTNQDEVEDILRTMIMAHEMQHCDRSKDGLVISTRETDADLAAVEAVRDAGYDAEAVDEAVKLYVSARINASLGPDTAYNTGFNIFNILAGDDQVSAYMNFVICNALNKKSGEVIGNNIFPDDMEEDERRYHAIAALFNSGWLEEHDKDSTDYASKFIKAYEYLHQVSHNALMTAPDYHKTLDLSFLTKGADIEIPAVSQSMDFKPAG